MEIPQERTLVTEIPGPRSRELLARRDAAVPAAVFNTVPIFARAASGAIVEDVDGNRLIDLGAGLAVLNVGSASPPVVEAVRSQAELYTHTCFKVVMHEHYAELAERLNALTPGSHPKKTMLANSGAEAVENAVKIARYVTKRSAVVVFDHAFHGRTLMAMTLTGKVMPYKQGFGPFAPEVYRLPYSYPYRCPAGAPAESCGEACAAHAIDEMDKAIGASNIACIELEDVVPDMVVTAKALGGGLPLSGVTAPAEVMDAVHVGGLGGTFGGNPIACAAALAVLDEIEREGLVDRASRLGEVTLDWLRKLADRHELIGDVRGRGLMVAIELVEDRATKQPAKAAATRVIQECYREGVIVLKAGTYDNVIRLLPPLSIDEGLLMQGLDVLDKALAAAAD